MNKENLPQTDLPEQEIGMTPAEEIAEAPAEAAAEAPAAEKPAKAQKPAKSKKGVSRRFRFGAMSTALTAVVIVVILLLNVVAGILSDRFPWTVDLSADGLFSLSEESVKIAQNVKDEVEIVVFQSEASLKAATGSQESDTIQRQLLESLRQFGVHSGNKITHKFVDLTGSPELITEYEKYEVATGAVLMLFRAKKGTAQERYQTLSGYDLFVQEQDSYGQIKVSSQVEKMLASKVNTVGNDAAIHSLIFSGHNEDSSTVQSLKNVLSLNGYVMHEVNPATAAEWNADSTLAVIAAPIKDYTTAEIDKLRLWMDNNGKKGRNLLVMVNYTADCPNLYAFLKDEHGIEVTDNMVVETDPGRMLMSGQNALIVGDVADTDFTKDIATKPLISLYTRQLRTHWDGGDMEATFPVITFPESARLQQMSKPGDSSEEKEPVKAEGYPITGMAYSVLTKYDNSGVRPVVLESKVIVCGSKELINASVLAFGMANEKAFVGVLNGVNDKVESVQVSARPLNVAALQFSVAESSLMGAIFVIVIPVITLIICLIVFLKRRHL